MLPKNDTPSYMKYVPFPYLKHVAVMAFVLVFACVGLGATGFYDSVHSVISHQSFDAVLLMMYGLACFVVIVSSFLVKNPQMDHFFSSAWAPFSVLIPVFFMAPRVSGPSVFQTLLTGALNMGASLA